MTRTIVYSLLGSSLALAGCAVETPSSGPSSDQSTWPLRTSDPTQHPGFYDTEIVSVDSAGRKTVVWQHTTPEQYAREVATHTGKTLPGEATAALTNTSNDTASDDVGASSSALISQVDCSNSNSVWFYNYDSRYNWLNYEYCSAPDGLSHLRVCYANDSTTNGQYYDLSQDTFYIDDGQGGYYGPYNWSGNIYMIWPPYSSSEAGSLGNFYWVWTSGGWQHIWGPSSSWNSSTQCEEAGTTPTYQNQYNLYLQ